MLEMTVQDLTQKQLIELDCIQQDAKFFVELVLSLISQKSAGIFMPSLMSYNSLFAIESYKYFQRTFSSSALTLSSSVEPIIREARLRTKFFEERKRKVEGVFELLDWVNEYHTEWHVNRHKGLLAPLKRVLQDDFGIFFYDGHIIGSTHTGFLGFGYSKNDLPNDSQNISSTISSLSHSVGKELGQYFTNVLATPEINLLSLRNDNYFLYAIDDKLLGYIDTKSERFLPQIFNGSGHNGINLTMLVFLTQMNFLLYILKNLMLGSPYTLFKIQYIGKLVELAT